MIKANSISHRYKDVLAVDDVSFEIAPGEIVGLLGHNGAGKSTIMRILTGFLNPVEGEVWLEGKNIWDDLMLAQQKIGYLPENNILYPEMTVADYLVYVGILNGVERNSVLSLIKLALTKTGLDYKVNQVIGTLSKGYQQRVGVAQAILHGPEVLILDEPTNGLDPTQVQQMRRTITNLSSDDTAVVLSTHVLKEVESICDRVIVIKEGRKVLDSGLSELSEGQRLLLTVDRTLDRTVSFDGLPTVALVEFLEENSIGYKYALTPRDSETMAAIGPQVANLVVKSGVGLHELSLEKRDLETIFNEIEIAR